MCAYPLVIVHFDSFERNEQLATITPDFHREFSYGLQQLRLILSCGWIQVVAVSSPGGWMQVTAESSSCGWIQVTADPSSGGLIRVAADSVLWLT